MESIKVDDSPAVETAEQGHEVAGVSRTERLAVKIGRDLLESFGIDHPVLQFETAPCGEGELQCQLACGGNHGGHA